MSHIAMDMVTRGTGCAGVRLVTLRTVEDMSWLLQLLVTLTWCVGSVQLSGNTRKAEMVYNTTELLDGLLLGYDKKLRPGFGGPATVVDVNLNIRSMGPISEIDMAYQMDCYFRQSWVDTRLRFSGPLKVLPVSVGLLDRLWKPDTHFFNGKRSYLHTVTTPNKLLRINQDGRILYSMRLTIKATCPMHLENFPMDTQTCPIRFGSHGYQANDVEYIWTHGSASSIKMAPDMRLSQFDLIGFPAGNETARITGGDVSMLYAHFVLKRHMGYFLINVYVPCSMLVVISWVSFWINREATADRIALGITTVLTMAFLGIDNRVDLPKVSYSTALDYFVGMCFAFVLATIIQFAGVHFFTKTGSGEILPESADEEQEEEEEEITQGKVYFVNRDRRCTVHDRANGDTQLSMQYGDLYYPKVKEHCCTKFYNCLKGSAEYRDMKMKTRRRDGVNSVSKIDTMSRIIFPVVFIIFNIFYWIIYLNKKDQGDDLISAAAAKWAGR